MTTPKTNVAEATATKVATTLKNAENVSRGNSFSIDPREIHIDKERNTRTDYGTRESLDELKESIRVNGVETALKVRIIDGKITLSHGYRRMSVITELLNEGLLVENFKVNIEYVKSEEQELLQHLTLNSGKPLTDLEIGETLVRLQKLTGEESFAKISVKSGIPYQKVVKLMNFTDTASAQVKEVVAKKEVSISDAMNFVAANPEMSTQNALLAEAKKEAITLKNGKNKIDLTANVKPKATKQTAEKVDANQPLNDCYDKLWDLIGKAEASPFNTQLQNLLTSFEMGSKTEAELLEMFK